MVMMMKRLKMRFGLIGLRVAAETTMFCVIIRLVVVAMLFLLWMLLWKLLLMLLLLLLVAKPYKILKIINEN